MNSSGFNISNSCGKLKKIMSNRRTANSHSNIPYEKKNNDSNNHKEKRADSPQGETSVELKTKTTDNTQQNHSQNPESSYS